MSSAEDLFDGFDRQIIDTAGATIHLRTGGSGPPLLLLHGYPQSHAMWHRIAPGLAERFTLVIPDLRGYGESACPPADTLHFNYSKRAMANDCVEIMEALGFEEFRVAGHDRGGRVAYRLALDHPYKVNRVAVLDILPTAEMWRAMDAGLAMTTYHWMFLAQPYPLPETLIGGAPDYYLHHTLASWTRAKDLTCFSQAALDHYRAAFTRKEHIAAACEDYRAGQSYDRRADEADREKGTKIRCPLLALWGAKGFPGAFSDPLEVWRGWAQNVEGQAIDAGHFLCEEAPEETLEALMPFMRR